MKSAHFSLYSISEQPSKGFPAPFTRLLGIIFGHAILALMAMMLKVKRIMGAAATTIDTTLSTIPLLLSELRSDD